MSFGRPYIMKIEGCIHDGWLLLRDHSAELDQNYLYLILGSKPVIAQFERSATGGVVNNLNSEIVREVRIPLPPLAVQKEIVAEIEDYQRLIDGARTVLESYRPHIPVLADCPFVRVGDLVESVLIGLGRSRGEQDPKHPHPYIKMNNITADFTMDLSDLVHVDASPAEVKKYSLNDGDFIYNTRNAADLVGKSAVFHGDSGKYLFNNNILRIRFGKRALPDFVNTVMGSAYGRSKMRAQVDGTTSVAALYQKNYMEIEIPLPSVAVQQAIVAEIQEEQKLVSTTRQLIVRFERKIHDALARIWGEEGAGARA